MKQKEEEILKQTKSTYLEYLIIRHLPKTVTILVRNKEHDESLGRIFWLSRWRCYVFEPDSATVYEKKCLRDIANLLETLTNNQREK